jgi:hypothetical protein
MFSFISMNWSGRPLVSYRTIVELISNTTTVVRGSESEPKKTSTTTRPAPRSAPPSSPQCHSRLTRSMATGTTRLRNQSIGEPLASFRGGVVHLIELVQAHSA